MNTLARVESCSVFVPSPRPGAGVFGSSYYTRPRGEELISVHWLITRSDTADVAYVRHSSDNGRTWGEAATLPCHFADGRGMGRRHPRGGYVDPPTGRYITIWTEGVLPTDDPLEGMRQWKLHYSVSADGGRTQLVNEQIIHEGPQYDAVHHLPGVTAGCNCVMMGDLGQRPLTRSDGTILVPVQSSPAGPDGMYCNPGAGYTYTDCLLLMGRWRGDGGLSWRASQRIVGDPARTTRGMIEPTIAELADGRILMVMRGSNDARPQLPGYRWCAFSADGGETWSQPQPWTYDDGEAFFSPSSCSQLIPCQDGRLLWMGNICRDNPSGNSPRYPIVLCEVDRGTGRVMRQSQTIIDDRREGESPRLTLSNFYVRQDRCDGSLLLHMTRFFARQPAGGASQPDWTADAMLYRIVLR